MSVYFGDVAVRARGMTAHLLSRAVLGRLARSADTGVLAGALQDAGYWPAPAQSAAPRSAAEVLESGIEYETMRRFGVLARWLGERRGLFAGVFDDEERRALRVWLRGFASGGGDAPAPHPRLEETWSLPPRLRGALARSGSLAEGVRALRRGRSPWAGALGGALRQHGDRPERIESELDRAFFGRARAGARQVGGRLVEWVAEAIDLENAWEALLGGGGGFIEGGSCLSRARYEAIGREPSEPMRRRQLADALAPGPLARPFADEGLALANLESRALAARIAAERRAARMDPAGVPTILECVMRLRGERADLRRINWGIAQGSPASAIAEHLVRAR